jgi:aminoglycoside phosphotransferase (APT) family kinase protein
MVDGLDLAALSDFLAPIRAGLGDPTHATTPERTPTWRADLIKGGKSNLTYRLSDGSHEWVLRRPPLGHVLATAHDMAREYRVMAALAPTPVPVPAMVTLCEDTSVIGAPFYVMKYVEGSILQRTSDTAHLADDQRRALACQLIDTLTDLHDVDPSLIGLGDFGRPEGFLQRQVSRWAKQLGRSRSRDIPGSDDLADQLAARVPASHRSAVVHGDYRLDNVIVGPDLLIRAVLDWEMATLGDPLCDLGLLIVYALPVPGVAGVISDGMGPHNGFPSIEFLIERYADRSGLDVSALAWYTALGYYKLAVICEGIHFRYAAGQTVGEGFDQIGDIVRPLVSAGLEALTG